jgi:hypothetical protein
MFAVAHDDGTFTVTFDWSNATADTAFIFLTSKELGTANRRGMGCYLRHALQSFVKLLPSASHSIFFSGLLKLKGNQKALGSAGTNKDLKRHFAEAFAASRSGVTAAMQVYVTSHPVKLYAVRNEAENGRLIPISHLAQHGDINSLARVIVLMAEPTVVLFLFK